MATLNIDDFERIYDEAVHLCQNGSKIQALVHILGCYGCKNEWREIRCLLMNNHPLNFRYADSYFHAIRSAYNRACSKIERQYGRQASYNTLSY